MLLDRLMIKEWMQATMEDGGNYSQMIVKNYALNFVVNVKRR